MPNHPALFQRFSSRKIKGSTTKTKPLNFTFLLAYQKKHNGGAFKGIALVSTETPLEKISRFATGVTL